MKEGSVRLRFNIRDSGIRISHDTLSSLFNPFTQADGSTTRKFGGTGLGLAICKQLAEGMSGRVGVESTPGEGSTFWFRALLGYDEDGEPAAAGRDLHGMRILGLERHEPARLSLESNLSLLAGSVELLGDAGHFAHALKLRRQDNDVILLDTTALDDVEGELQSRGLALGEMLNCPVILTGPLAQEMFTEIGGRHGFRPSEDAIKARKAV
jgi:two-component system sensor histidine kinase/response regulator